MSELNDEIQALAKAIGAADLIITVLPKLKRDSYTVPEIITLLAKAKTEYTKELGVKSDKDT